MGKTAFERYIKENYAGPYVATDVIIRYSDGIKKGIVLIERKNYPHGKAIPGGMAERMPLNENAIKEGEEETGLEVKIDDPDRPFCVRSNVNRDPRADIASIVYTGEGSGIIKPHEDEDAKSAALYANEEVEELLKDESIWAFKDHMEILKMYLKSEYAKK